MNKILEFFGDLKLVRKNKVDAQIQTAIDDANGELIEKIRGLTEFESYFGRDSAEFFSVKESLFNEVFAKKKIENPEVRNILLNAFDNVPSVDLSFEELYLIQDAIWTKYGSDPLIQGAVDNYTDYVIGGGVAISTPVDDVNKVLEDFERRNQWFSRQQAIVKNSFIDGEHFTLLYTNANGDVYVRKCHPKSIETMETAKTDYEVLFSILRRLYMYDDQGGTTYSDARQYIKTLEYDDLQNAGLNYNRSIHTKDFIQNVVVSFLKLNDSDKLRGLPPLKRVLKWSKLYENFIMDRMVLNHERAKVVWIKTYGMKPRDPLPNKSYKSPPQGSMMIEKDGIKYRTEKPNLDSSEAKEDGLGLLYYIATSIRMPIHILNQRTDQQVYASIRKADTPFQNMVESAQYMYAEHFEGIYRHQIKEKVKRGDLKKKYEYSSYAEDAVMTAVKQINKGVLDERPVEEIRNEVKKTLEDGKFKVITPTENLPISQDFPQMILQDPKEMAEVLKLHKEVGLASIATLSGKAGYTWKKEFPKIMAEFAINLEKKREEQEIITEGKENEIKKEDKVKKKEDKK